MRRLRRRRAGTTIVVFFVVVDVEENDLLLRRARTFGDMSLAGGSFPRGHELSPAAGAGRKPHWAGTPEGDSLLGRCGGSSAGGAAESSAPLSLLHGHHHSKIVAVELVVLGWALHWRGGPGEEDRERRTGRVGYSYLKDGGNESKIVFKNARLRLFSHSPAFACRFTENRRAE